MVEHDGIAGLDVGGHRPERDGKLLEIADVVRLRRKDAEERLDRYAGEHARRQREAAILHAEFGPEQRLVVVHLAPDRDFLPRRLVAEDFVPIGLEDDLLQFLRRHARGERGADNGAHARARHAVDRDAHLLEDLEDADMRDAARAAAG